MEFYVDKCFGELDGSMIPPLFPSKALLFTLAPPCNEGHDQVECDSLQENDFHAQYHEGHQVQMLIYKTAEEFRSPRDQSHPCKIPVFLLVGNRGWGRSCIMSFHLA